MRSSDCSRTPGEGRQVAKDFRREQHKEQATPQSPGSCGLQQLLHLLLQTAAGNGFPRRSNRCSGPKVAPSRVQVLEAAERAACPFCRYTFGTESCCFLKGPEGNLGFSNTFPLRASWSLALSTLSSRPLPHSSPEQLAQCP